MPAVRPSRCRPARRAALAPGIGRSPNGGRVARAAPASRPHPGSRGGGRDVVDAGPFDELCDDIGWLDQSRMRAFLRGRGWRVPWLGRFFQVPEARRELFVGGPSAVLGLDWRGGGGRVTPTWLWFGSAAGGAPPLGHPSPPLPGRERTV